MQPRPAPPRFAEIFQRYSGFVWKVLMRLGVPIVDIDDVRQEVFLSVHRSLPQFEGRCSLHTWIYGICQRRVIDYRRKMQTRPWLPWDGGDRPSMAPTQESELICAQARTRLAHVLRSLDPSKRAVFVLFELQGLAMDQVAERLGCPLHTAYSRLYAGRRLIEASLLRTLHQDAP